MSTTPPREYTDAMATSGHSYLIHRFFSQLLSAGTGQETRVYTSKCGTVAVSGIDRDPEMVKTAKRCKRCFK
jgi:trans-aconitate methyltransferase